MNENIDKELKNKIAERLIENGDLITIVRDINSCDGSLDNYNYWENDEEFFSTFYDNDIMEAVRASCYGDYTFTDDYVIINAYGNLDSVSMYELLDMLEDAIDEIVDCLIDVWGSYSSSFDLPDDIKSMLDTASGVEY